MLVVMELPSASSAHLFATAVEVIGAAARRRGLAVPGFRSPPRVRDANRTLRRRPDGGAVVAVQVRGRAAGDVVADVIEGIVAANGLSGPAAARCRAELFDAASTLSVLA
jgi:hypothetical protein